MKGSPSTMQKSPHYEDTVGEICDYLKQAADKAVQAGISPHAVIIDPGIGFGKRLCDNLLILDSIEAFKRLGFPVLIGASRKSFMNAILTRPVDERLAGSLAAAVIAVMRGAAIIRVHDVAETKDALTLVHAVRTANGEGC
jgi:dihydropteroate synthase